MAVDVMIPTVGESVQEGMIHKWHKKDGEYVDVDDVILEVETDKATVEIVAEASGAIKTLKNEGDTVEMGEVVAKIDTDAAKPKGDGAKESDGKSDAAPADAANKAAPGSSQKPAAAAASGTLSPAVNRLVSEHNLDPSQIDGTGKGGRLTKEDVVKHMDRAVAAPKASAAPAARSATPPPAKGPAPTLPTPAIQSERSVRREPMSMMRRRIAERLVSAQQTAAILTTFNEIDLHNFIELRNQYKDVFKEKHGVGLGFMSIFVKASIEALKAYPAINGWVEGNELVYHDYYDVGVAVSSDRGLVVPVIRDVDKLSFAEVEQSILFYANKAREGKISIDDMSGGTFTISNGGVFGSLLSTPILNPPQSGILGMHKTQPRPVVVNGEIVIRPMMYVALSYDHRIVDGKEAVQFLVKVKECVEDPQRLLLGV